MLAADSRPEERGRERRGQPGIPVAFRSATLDPPLRNGAVELAPDVAGDFSTLTVE